MTVRSVLTGLVGAVLVCGLTFVNDYVLHQTYMVGNHFPVSVFGALLFFLLVNALVARFRRRWAFTGRELAVALGMTLVACCIPSQGLMAILPTAITMPHRFGQTEPGLGSGAGLGLSIVKTLVEQNGGVIRAESGAGTGSTFVVEFGAG